MRGRTQPLLDALSKSGFDEEIEVFSTAEGDPNHVLDEYPPSVDRLFHGSLLAGCAKPKLGRMRPVGLDVWPRTNELRSALRAAHGLRSGGGASMRVCTGRAGMRLCPGPMRAGLPVLYADGYLPHILSARAYRCLYAGRRRRSLQRLRGDDLSSNNGLDLSRLVGVLSDVSSRLCPRGRQRRLLCPMQQLQRLRQLRPLRPVQRLFAFLRRLLGVRRLLGMRDELRRLFGVRHNL